MDGLHLRRAVIFAAIGILQDRISRTNKVYLLEAYERAADNLLARVYDEQDEAEPPIAHKFASSAFTNAKKTVRVQDGHREDGLVAMHADPLGRWPVGQVEASIDCQALLQHATPKQRAVLKLRLAGREDEEIAAELAISLSYVPALAHRGVIRIRSMAG